MRFLAPVFVIGSSLASVFLASPGPAVALERGSYSMEILVDGVPLREQAARGTTYVEARKGHEYSIRLSNRTGERVAVALSVDGLNSIDAKTTTAADARKWILDPYQTITLDGWQTSTQMARRFFFTTEEDSYGVWLGRTKNLGVITAAVFREKHQDPVPIQGGRLRKDSNAEPEREESQSRLEAPASREGAPSRDESGATGSPGNERVRGKTRLADDLAATGIGREVDHRVVQVAFDQEDSATCMLQVRYEYRDALVRLGVIPPPRDRHQDPLARRERACGFEEGFAPDPYDPCPR